MTQSVVCVLGMHRSGTSLAARLLGLLGWEAGPDGHLVEVAPDNPHGFWENSRLSAINREILRRAGGSWSAPPRLEPGWDSEPEIADLLDDATRVVTSDFGAAERWMWKDPRTCLTLPFWRRVLRRMQYVLVVRDPIDVAESLARRHGEPIDRSHSFELWLTYVSSSLRHTADADRLLVFYEDLVADPRAHLHRFARFLGEPGRADRPKVAEAASAVTDRYLWHHRTPPSDVGDTPDLPPAVEALYAALRLSHAPSAELAARDDEIDRLRADVRARDRELRTRASTDMRSLRSDLQMIRHDVRKQAAELHRVVQRFEHAEKVRAQDERSAGESLVREIRSAVDAVVPAGARLLVASTGNDDLLRLRGRRASHFPQGEGGRYAGRDPASSRAAVDHLEALRRRGAQYLVLTPSTIAWLDRFDGFREHLSEGCRLVHRDERCVVYDVRRRRRLLRTGGNRRRDDRGRSRQRRRRTERVGPSEYAQLRDRVRKAVDETVPAGSTVIVISKGDDELLRLGPRTAWHFPRADDGRYAGYYPSDGPTAVAALDEAQAKGGEFLVVPRTAAWWLDHYPELRRRLEDGCRLVPQTGDDCVVYDLRGAGRGSVAAGTDRSRDGAPEANGRSDPVRAARVQRVIDTLPLDASVVVLADHDDELRDTGLRLCRSLPVDHDATAAGTVAELERYRHRGAEFLVVPEPSEWWKRRPGFRRHIEQRYARVSKDRHCAIYDLRMSHQTRSASLKVSVLCWDMGHNPLGRAHVLADVLREEFDVEIVGPHFDRYGTSLWEPLRDSLVPMRTFRGTRFPDHLATMDEVAERIDGDVIYVSKPRLPSLGMGALAKARTGSPLILDLDEDEMTFFADRAIRTDDLRVHARDPEFRNPFGDIWTRYCGSLVHAADRVTVSNHVLQDRYGGTIIPHARDERVFDPSRYDRDAVRAELGLDQHDRLILFAGTPRKHKGITEIARALSRLGNTRYRLGIIATGEFAEIRSQLGADARFVHDIPVQPFDRLPAVLTAADLVCVLQDPSSAISRYQIPAKITDAIAMGVPCIATPVPPIEPLVERGAVLPLGETPLHELIDATLTDVDAARRRAPELRELFLETSSYAAVRPKLESLVRTASWKPRPMSDELAGLVALMRSVFATRDGSRRGRTGAIRPAPGRRPQPRPAGPARATAPATPPALPMTAAAPASFDLVVFWKHNDTGIYGRRQDMLVKHLAASERIDRIVHLDAPVDLTWLGRSIRPDDPHANHARLLARQTLGRVAGRSRREGKVSHHTFLHRGHNRSFAARLLPVADGYIEWIASVLDRHGIGDKTTVFWAYPRLIGFPEIVDALAPDLVVSDVVDDDRTWSEDASPLHDALTRNYQEILARSDLVIASTPYVRDAMSAFADEIHIVPNACEFPAPSAPKTRPPRELRRLRGPIIGYVGNLSSRIDIPLLEQLATDRPEWNLVLIGSAHLDRQILRLQAHRNVHVLGVKPYERAKDYIRAFDVAIIPHLDDPMTRSMHPLKAFAYAAQNVPIVSTDIANLGELRPFVHIANGPAEFIRQVEIAIAAGKRDAMPPELEAVLARNSWPERAKSILELIDRAVARRSAVTRVGAT
jgi:glycosyltransferase involved in cell wall biosynthesis